MCDIDIIHIFDKNACYVFYTIFDRISIEYMIYDSFYGVTY